jgi:hypothetical protein
MLTTITQQARLYLDAAIYAWYKVLFAHYESLPINWPPPQENYYSAVAYANLNVMIITSELSNVLFKAYA